MKKIFLVGDSIRKGYDKYVKAAFRNIAEVYYVEDNNRFAAYTYRHLSDWLANEKAEHIDVLHWNAGLWDCLMLDDEHLCPIEIYAYYIERICKRIKKLCPDAKVIFATSTPVVEERFVGEAKRYNKDIEAYNKVATEIATKYGFEIDDLYAVAQTLPVEAYSDMTHMYTELGTKTLTDAVCKSIAKALCCDESELCEFCYPVSETGEVIGL